MRKSIDRSLLIILAGVALGFLGNAVSPRGIPFITPPKKEAKLEEFIPLERAKTLWEGGGAVFLDAREPVDFAAGHIGNAWNLPVLAFDKHFPEVAPTLTPEGQIVVYCDGKECELSHQLKARLSEVGFTNVYMLLNGWTVWREAGLPTEQGERK